MRPALYPDSISAKKTILLPSIDAGFARRWFAVRDTGSFITPRGFTTGYDYRPCHERSPELVELQTNRIQEAIDTVATRGGGTVRIESGLRRIGTIPSALASRFTSETAVSSRAAARSPITPRSRGDFTDAVEQQRDRCLIYAEDTIGTAHHRRRNHRRPRRRLWLRGGRTPLMVRFIDCEDVQVAGITLQNSPG